MTSVAALAEPSAWAFLAAAVAPFVAPVLTATAAIIAVGFGQRITYAREETARLKREKREAAAQALAAWRDLATAQALGEHARVEWEAAS